MTYKRIIGTLVVKNDVLVKSYGFKFYRPAGSVITAIINLDSWMVDEIFIIDITDKDYISYNLLQEINNSKCITPITYGGGIRNSDDIKLLLQSGVDRVLVESILYCDQENLRDCSDFIGSQAVVASVPVYFDGKDYISWYHFNKFKRKVLLEDLIKLLDKNLFSEYLIMDVNNEGNEGCFNLEIFNILSNIDKNQIRHNFIFFGGMDFNCAAFLLSN